jgi:hypothetical protein
MAKKRKASAQLAGTPEFGVLNLPLNDSTDDIVALQDASLAADVGTHLQIEAEFMTVLDASDMSNLRVERGVNSAIEAHLAGAEVMIGVELPADDPKPAVVPCMTDEQFTALIAAVLYVRPGSHGLDDCVDMARNLISIAETVPVAP